MGTWYVCIALLPLRVYAAVMTDRSHKLRLVDQFKAYVSAVPNKQHLY